LKERGSARPDRLVPICADSLQRLENQIRAKAEESLDADIADFDFPVVALAMVDSSMIG